MRNVFALYLGSTLVVPLVRQQLRRRVRFHLHPDNVLGECSDNNMISVGVGE